MTMIKVLTLLAVASLALSSSRFDDEPEVKKDDKLAAPAQEKKIEIPSLIANAVDSAAQADGKAFAAPIILDQNKGVDLVIKPISLEDSAKKGEMEKADESISYDTLAKIAPHVFKPLEEVVAAPAAQAAAPLIAAAPIAAAAAAPAAEAAPLLIAAAPAAAAIQTKSIEIVNLGINNDEKKEEKILAIEGDKAAAAAPAAAAAVLISNAAAAPAAAAAPLLIAAAPIATKPIDMLNMGINLNKKAEDYDKPEELPQINIIRGPQQAAPAASIELKAADAIIAPAKSAEASFNSIQAPQIAALTDLKSSTGLFNMGINFDKKPEDFDKPEELPQINIIRGPQQAAAAAPAEFKAADSIAQIKAPELSFNSIQAPQIAALTDLKSSTGLFNMGIKFDKKPEDYDKPEELPQINIIRGPQQAAAAPANIQAPAQAAAINFQAPAQAAAPAQVIAAAPAAQSKSSIDIFNMGIDFAKVPADYDVAKESLPKININVAPQPKIDLANPDLMEWGRIRASQPKVDSKFYVTEDSKIDLSAPAPAAAPAPIAAAASSSLSASYKQIPLINNNVQFAASSAPFPTGPAYNGSRAPRPHEAGYINYQKSAPSAEAIAQNASWNLAFSGIKTPNAITNPSLMPYEPVIAAPAPKASINFAAPAPKVSINFAAPQQQAQAFSSSIKSSIFNVGDQQ